MESEQQSRILYLYDHEGWAIHNVGKLWLDDLAQIDVTFRPARELTKSDVSSYDIIWFGYFHLFSAHYVSAATIMPSDLHKCIVSIHDPSEFYPQQENWKEIAKAAATGWHPRLWKIRGKLSILHGLPNVVTISSEMQSILGTAGIVATLIPTASALPPAATTAIKTVKCDVLSVFALYERKNLPMMNAIRNECEEDLNIRFDAKIGRTALPLEDYIDIFDSHEIYVCTSYQEGGPLPAMDAMQRGCVVLSTPVGQIQDLIQEGANGFICSTQEQFIEKIEMLSSDLPLLNKMRIQSATYMRSARDVGAIRYAVLALVQDILATRGRRRQTLFAASIWPASKVAYLANQARRAVKQASHSQGPAGTSYSQ